MPGIRVSLILLKFIFTPRGLAHPVWCKIKEELILKAAATNEGRRHSGKEK
jgi:hypothetical protein